MITRVQVKNFRSLADIDVTLGPLTVLVGRNGAGKSAFVDVLRFVRDALRFNLETAIRQRGGIASLRRWSPTKPYDIEISLETDTSNYRREYSFVIGSTKQGEYWVKREAFRTGNTEQLLIEDGKLIEDGLGAGFQTLGKLLQNKEPDDKSLLLSNLNYLTVGVSRLYSSLTRTAYYSIFPNLLREPQQPDSEKWLEDDGTNLAAVLRRIKQQDEWFRDLVAALHKIVDDVNDIRVQLRGGYLVTELRHETQNKHSPWFPLKQESDGTLRILGILVALYQDAKHELIAIEEPEIALHPGVLSLLRSLLREASLRNQILITAQSPDLISCFSVDDLRIVERVNGITKIGPIDEIQRDTINEQLFSAGDLLRIEDLHRATEEPVGAESG